MILLRMTRWCRSALPYVLMVLLVTEGLLAVAAMFTMPPIAVLLVFVGVGTIAVYVAVGWILQGLDRLLMKLLGVATADG
jgi:hypothetical protein